MSGPHLDSADWGLANFTVLDGDCGESTTANTLVSCAAIRHVAWFLGEGPRGRGGKSGFDRRIPAWPGPAPGLLTHMENTPYRDAMSAQLMLLH